MTFETRNETARRREFSKPIYLAIPVMGCAFAFLGCAPATSGSWRFARTDPPGIEFPLEKLELDPSGEFRSTSVAYGESIPAQGQYKWRGDKLLIGRPGFEPRAYRVKRHRDGRIEFIYREDGRRVSALFEPVSSDEASETNATNTTGNGRDVSSAPDAATADSPR